MSIVPVIEKSAFRPKSYNRELLIAFLTSVEDTQDAMNRYLAALGRNPADKDALNAMFRSVHSLKSDCKMCYLDPFTDFVHSIEDLLAAVRSGELIYSGAIGEVMLLSLDHFIIRVKDVISHGEAQVGTLSKASALFHRLINAPAERAQTYLSEAMQLIGGSTLAELELDPDSGQPPEMMVHPVAIDMSIPDEDLSFFIGMGRLIDRKYVYWQNRSQQQLKLALSVNQRLKRPCNERQLSAAVCLHDIGMIFLPDSIMNKNDKYNSLEESHVRQHVQWSHEWMYRLRGCAEAAALVLQHHERPDGSGYPHGLKGDAIDDGAQVIAIVDAFFSITNERSDRTFKKSLLRAIAEINAYRDLQFKGNVVEAFNAVIRDSQTSTAAAPPVRVGQRRVG